MSNEVKEAAESLQPHPFKWKADSEQKIFGAGNNPSQPVPAEILHLSIFHSGPGVDELVRFYQVALNLRYVFKGDYATWEFIALSNDDEHHRVGIVNAFAEVPDEITRGHRKQMVAADGVQPRELPQRPCRLEHSSWRYHSFEDVLRAARYTHSELGLWPRTARFSPVDFLIDYLDPDGNRVEMGYQFPETKGSFLFGIHSIFEQFKEMETPPVMDYDFFYMPVNMEKMVGLYNSGVPLSDLQNRSFIENLKAEGKV